MRQLQHIFQPGWIGNVQLKNRLIMAPMVTLYATDEGQVSDRMIDYYVERAKGGVGMIIIETTCIHEGGKRFHNNLCIYDDKFLPGLEKLVKKVKEAGTKIFIQLFHGGRECSSKFTGQQIVAPSATPSYYRGIVKGEEIPKELNKEEIYGLVDNFCQGAARAQKAGFDGVEIHGAHGYLITQFLSPYSNKRSDEFGGDIFGRSRFLEEIIELIRIKLYNYPVIVRLNGEDGVTEGNTIQDSKIISERLKQKGVDALHISAGFHESRPYLIVPNMSFEKMCYVSLAEQIKSATNIPVIAVGRITKPEEAELVLKIGKADFVALGRALLADPEFPNKAFKGDLSEIRKCISCNQGCIDMCHKALPITCIYNPSVGREKESIVRISKKPKKVDVIGGGPAGMEAAYIAAMQGHMVDLYETSDSLGGQLRAAMIPPTRRELFHITEYLEHQLKKWDVKVHFHVKVNEDFFKDLRSDVIILAIGSIPTFPEFPISNQKIFLAQNVLLGEANIGEGFIAIIGGGLVGCETADFLGERGNKIIMFEMLSDICTGEGTATRVYLVDKLKKLNVEVKTNAEVTEINSDQVYYEYEGEKKVISGITAVVLATGYSPNNKIKKILDGMGTKYYEVGDCRKVGNVLESVHSGFWVAKSI